MWTGAGAERLSGRQDPRCAECQGNRGSRTGGLWCWWLWWYVVMMCKYGMSAWLCDGDIWRPCCSLDWVAWAGFRRLPKSDSARNCFTPARCAGHRRKETLRNPERDRWEILKNRESEVKHWESTCFAWHRWYRCCLCIAHISTSKCNLLTVFVSL